MTLRVLGTTFVAALLLAATSGCGEPAGDAADPRSSTPELEGAPIALESAVERWSLLAIPRSGGTATARRVKRPTDVVWTGDTTLPASSEVHVLEGPVVVLRTARGIVHRYEPRSGELSRVARLQGSVRWEAWGGQGVYVDTDAGRIVQIGAEGAWEYELARAPLWAAPVEGGRVAVLVEGGEDGPELWMASRGSAEPETRASGDFAPVGTVVAWGRRLVLASGDRRVLKFVVIPSLTVSGEVRLPGPVTAVARSPSSHEVYAAVEDPPRWVRVSRFVEEVEATVRLERPLVGLRPATLGQFVLGYDGETASLLSLTGRSPRTLRTAWRSDLPLGTPDGAVLLAREEGLYRWAPGSEGAAPVPLPADHWWAAVRWSPAPPPVVASRVEAGPVADDTGGSALPTPEGAADRAEPGAALPPLGAGPGPAGPGRDTARSELPRAGFYAIAVSARQRRGVERLTARLSEAGYPTAVQRYEDDAGREWFRGMVGPYATRSEAEAAARDLNAEQDLSAWVTEVTPGAGLEDVLE